ncbi:hypothetical protein FOQG_18189, partial [Fusarium oxysporum f. sp. raphani 54005]
VILAPAEKVEDLLFGLESLEIFAVKESTSNQVQYMPKNHCEISSAVTSELATESQ